MQYCWFGSGCCAPLPARLMRLVLVQHNCQQTLLQLTACHSQQVLPRDTILLVHFLGGTGLSPLPIILMALLTAASSRSLALLTRNPAGQWKQAQGQNRQRKHKDVTSHSR
jgi:hypothetical protein